MVLITQCDPFGIWQVHGSGHTGGIDAAPDEYERRVVGFFDRYLDADAGGAGGRSERRGGR